MNNAFKTLKSNLILQSLAFVVAGVVILMIPNVTMMTLVYVLAFMLTIMGAWMLIAYAINEKRIARRRTRYASEGDGDISNIIGGILLLILPIVMFIVPGIFATFISILVGILLFLSGLINIMRSIKLRKTGDKSWIVSLIISVLIAGAGIMLLCNPFASAVIFVRILGICLVVNGLADLLLIYWSRNLEGSL